MWWFLCSRSGFSVRPYAICSSVIRPVLKQACPSERILSHMFMNRAINISLNASCLHIVDIMGDRRVRFKCATAVGLDPMCGTCGTRVS